MTAVNLSAAFDREPKDALDYFASKGYKITGGWDEMMDEAHAKAFTVAHCAKIDVLQDIRTALHESLQSGKTLEQFKKELIPVLQKKGWWGKETVTGQDGETRKVQLGSPHRLETIYRTNLQSAYMAARYQQMKAASATHPYWQYQAVMDQNTRPAHAAMHGHIFAHDDPVWGTCYPPNGYRCRCTVRTLSQTRMRREGLTPESSAGALQDVRVKAGRNKQETVTGVRIKDKNGKSVIFHPDAGFNHNAGVSWHKPFSPPPLEGVPDTGGIPLPRTLPDGVKLPPLLETGRMPSKKILPAGLTEEQYASAFLKTFGAGVGKPVVFKDKMNAPLIISEDLFKVADPKTGEKTGGWKILKHGRERYLLLLAEAIRDPDEIWLAWYLADNGKYFLRRRYVKKIALDDDKSMYAFSVFEESREGWRGITIFQPDVPKQPDRDREAERYSRKQRGDFLLYKKK